MSEKESEQTDTANKTNSKEKPWLVTKGLSHFEELVPEAPSLLVSDENSVFAFPGEMAVGNTCVIGPITEPPWISQNKVNELKYLSDIGVALKFPFPPFLTVDPWKSYQREMIKVRKKGGYTDRQAHYWRSRALFRFLNAGANKEQVTKLDFIQKRLQEIYPDVIQFGCEQVLYDSCDIEGWINAPCPLPDANDKKPKPWEDTISDMSQEKQMGRKSRLRECVQAIALIMFSRNTGLTDEAFIQMFSQNKVQKILDLVRVDDSSNRKKDWEPSEKLVRDWVKDLISSIHPVSKKGNRAVR